MRLLLVGLQQASQGTPLENTASSLIPEEYGDDILASARDKLRVTDFHTLIDTVRPALHHAGSIGVLPDGGCPLLDEHALFAEYLRSKTTTLAELRKVADQSEDKTAADKAKAEIEGRYNEVNRSMQRRYKTRRTQPTQNLGRVSRRVGPRGPRGQ